MPNWTPGPWKTSLNDSTGYGDFRHSIKHHEDGCNLTHAGCDSEQDAALIESAPALYTALDRITDITVSDADRNPAQWFADLRRETDNALKVLARARGEAK